MARYRQKDELDLVWNKIRRRLTRELDTQLQDWREDALNKVLSDAWDRYAKAIASGDVLELEAEYVSFVGKALDDLLPGLVVVGDAVAR